MQEVALTLNVVRVLKVFAENPDEARYGYDLMRETGFASGKLYPILARLTRAGWLDRQDPGPAPTKSEGPPRITYKLAPTAVVAAIREVESVSRALKLDLGQRSRPPRQVREA